jgi:hypothetical protein
VKESLPTKPRTSEKRLAIFEFVMKQPKVKVPDKERQAPKRLPWTDLMHHWNETLPQNHEWRSKDVGNFRQDFYAAFDSIVNYYR